MVRAIYFWWCRVMEPIWDFYHKWILHRGKLTFWTSCKHCNPYSRAYNDMREILKESEEK
jgi:hypothetical protein